MEKVKDLERTWDISSDDGVGGFPVDIPVQDYTCKEDVWINNENLKKLIIKYIEETEKILNNYIEEENGKLELKQIIQKLKKLGYKNWYETECEDFLGSCREVIEFLKYLFNINNKEVGKI